MKIIFYILLILSVIIISYTLFNTESENNIYKDDIVKHREEINEFMKEDSDSPLELKQKENFEGLIYYPIDEKYKVQAKVTLHPNPKRISLIMSDGSKVEYLKFAILEFLIDDIPQKLTLLKPDNQSGDPMVFLPFYDETSAIETYGGGRYLDMEYHNENMITLDFNKAYNPYCAYSDKYRCPLPPRENRITVAVKAGEKIYRKKD